MVEIVVTFAQHYEVINATNTYTLKWLKFCHVNIYNIFMLLILNYKLSRFYLYSLQKNNH